MQAQGRVRGIVMEQRGGEAVLLTPDGTFCQVRSEAGWQVGDEVRGRASRTARGRSLWMATGGLGACAAAAALVFGLVVAPAQARPVAYVNVYGASTVTLAVGSSGNVVSVTARHGVVPGSIHAGLSAAQAVDILTRIEGGPLQPGAPSGVMVAMYVPKGARTAPSHLAPMLAEVARRNEALFEAMPATGPVASAKTTPQPTPGRPKSVRGAVPPDAALEPTDEA